MLGRAARFDKGRGAKASDTGQSTLGRRPPRAHGATMMLSEPPAIVPDSTGAAGFVARAQEDAIARHLLRPHFPSDRELLLLAGFDSYERLTRIERMDGEGDGRCAIPATSWRRLIGRGLHTVIMAHNHPSGSPWPSEADRHATREAMALLRRLGIELADHMIFAEAGHFSFRRAGLL